MIFNSFEFAVFLPLIFCLYWLISNKNRNAQNFILLAASYIFYGWWDWRFLSLIAFSSGIDFIVGLSIEKTEKREKRKVLLIISIIVNLGFLGFFKYFNFFIDTFYESIKFLGHPIVDRQILNIVLPVGISFYTFQTLSYSIDVYRKKIKPTKEIITFFAYVSFFPQLVAGPIERAENLLPQFQNNRSFDYNKASDGMRQILWGLIKKVVIADNCAYYANRIFNGYEDFSGSTLLVGALFFSFQIYGDFSGYSDIAIGTSRLFGFNLKKNFSFPYFSRDIAEFWRKWHISLTTWFRDYLYIPLGGSKSSLPKTIRNVFIVFIISGFWHGANFTFIVWGALNAFYFLPLLILNKNHRDTEYVAKGRILPNIKEFIEMGSTFFLTLLAWVFFRSENLNKAFSYLSGIFNESIFSIPEIKPARTGTLLIAFIIWEWFQRDKDHALQLDENKIPIFLKWPIYYGLVIVLLMFAGSRQDFLYFQF